MANNDGGPAFPRPFSDDTECGLPCTDQEGMTLRDYFAAKAMQASFSDKLSSQEYLRLTAKWAYKMADAMLEARDHAS